MARASTVSLSGLLALAVAMGIGRFAFTPVLPMMQHDRGLTLAQGGWLASANYVGYLLGALYAMRSRMRDEIAIGGALAAIALATLAAAVEEQFVVLLVLRLVPGFASALVLVHVSAWALEALNRAGRPDLSGVVFAGVGVGIVFAGVVCVALVAASASSSAAWAALGGSAFVATLLVWPTVRSSASAAVPRANGARAIALRTYWRLIYAHAAFGFGYIVPATFLPVMARQAIGDSPLFGWAWPIFGAAAALSTMGTSRWAGRVHPRRTWRASLVVMAAGVAAPVIVPGLTGIVLSAIAVGATFMVATMLAMQEARREAGEGAKPLMGAMTTAFALGQIAGPLVAGLFIERHGGFNAVLLLGAAPLVHAAWLLHPVPLDREKT